MKILVFVARGLQALAISVPRASRAAVSRIASTSRVAAHGAATISGAATNTTTTAIARTAGTIASAAAATTNAALVPSRSARPYVDRGLQALAGTQTITALADDFAVSRKFVYQQADTAQAALDDAFTPSATADDQVLFSLPVTKAWLRQATLGLTLICHSSYRGVVEFCRDLLDVDLSVAGLCPPLHLPVVAGLAQGPGFPNLSCLGLLSDRILRRYVATDGPARLTLERSERV